MLQYGIERRYKLSDGASFFLQRVHQKWYRKVVQEAEQAYPHPFIPCVPILTVPHLTSPLPSVPTPCVPHPLCPPPPVPHPLSLIPSVPPLPQSHPLSPHSLTPLSPPNYLFH